MKKQFIYLAALLMMACSKEKDKDPTVVEKPVIKQCKQTQLKTFDGGGNPTGTSIYHYSNGRLDSMVSYGANNQKTFTFKYIYNSASERVVELYDAVGVKTAGYNIQTLDINGNVIESRGFNDNNVLQHKYQYAFDCN